MTGRDKTKIKSGYCTRCEYYKAAKHLKNGGKYFKVLIAVIILHGMLSVTMSYVLAWRDHIQIAENLSSTIITQIIAPVIVYGVTKTVENIFQKNQLSFSKPLESGESEVKG